MVKSVESKITKYSKLVDKYLNVVYELQQDLEGVESSYMSDLLEDIEGWKSCCEEMEYNIKSNKTMDGTNPHIIYDKENKNVTIY